MDYWTKVNNDILSDPRFTAFEFRILLYLLKFGDKCYPSRYNIMDGTGIAALATVDKVLKQLRDFKVIDWTTGTKGLHNRYIIRPTADWRIIGREAQINLGAKAMRANHAKAGAHGAKLKAQAQTAFLATDSVE